jgi:hypothetical protein
MARPQASKENSQPGSIPQGEFIDVLSNKPVEPTRLQVFPVPQEFLEQVLANEPPHLRPDDIKDTAPYGYRVEPNQLVPEPVSEITPVSTEPVRASAAPATSATVVAPSDEVLTTTTLQAKRPPVPLLTRWALTGKIPSQVKIAIGVMLAGLLLILLYRHMETGRPKPTPATENAPAATPLLEPPVSAAAQAPASTAGVQAPPENRQAVPPTADPRPADSSAQSAKTKPRTPIVVERKSQEAATPAPSAATANQKKAWFPED